MFADFHKMAEALPKPFNFLGVIALMFVEVGIECAVSIGLFCLAVYMVVYLARRTIIPVFIK